MMDFEDPKSTVSTVELPGGFRYIDEGEQTHLLRFLDLKEITGVEEDIIADRRTDPSDKMIRVISNCIKSATNQNGISVDNRGHIFNFVNEANLTDLVFLLLAVRRVSLGDIFSFEVRCPNKDCQNKFRRVVDLKDLPINDPLEPEDLFFEVTLPKTQRRARQKVMQAHDQKRARTLLQKGRNLATAQLLVRLVELDGKPPTVLDLQQLPLSDRNFLRNSYEKKEGGIDTGVEAVCERCGEMFDVELNVNSEDFFSPSETLEH